MQSYGEFFEKAKADADRRDPGHDVPYSIKSQNGDSFIAAWALGGWSASSEGGHDRSEEPEPEVEPLLELLDDMGLKRRQVNEIRALFKRDTTYDRNIDHNGSWVHLAYKVLSIDDLHEKLLEYGIVEPKAGPKP